MLATEPRCEKVSNPSTTDIRFGSLNVETRGAEAVRLPTPGRAALLRIVELGGGSIWLFVR